MRHAGIEMIKAHLRVRSAGPAPGIPAHELWHAAGIEGYRVLDCTRPPSMRLPEQDQLRPSPLRLK